MNRARSPTRGSNPHNTHYAKSGYEDNYVADYATEAFYN